jgi:hypothetical protein
MVATTLPRLSASGKSETGACPSPRRTCAPDGFRLPALRCEAPELLPGETDPPRGLEKHAPGAQLRIGAGVRAGRWAALGADKTDSVNSRLYPDYALAAYLEQL